MFLGLSVRGVALSVIGSWCSWSCFPQKSHFIFGPACRTLISLQTRIVTGDALDNGLV
jgi:hypothetical protein